MILGRLYLKSDPRHPGRSARIDGMHPNMLRALPIIVACFADVGSLCVLTSGSDGKHMDGSLHYAGLAADFRRWYVPEERMQDLLTMLRARLGPEYDVVLEGTHIHIEYDA